MEETQGPAEGSGPTTFPAEIEDQEQPSAAKPSTLEVEPKTPTYYPVSVGGEGKLSPNIYPGLGLVKPILTIPHCPALAVLFIAFVILTVITFWKIMRMGRYPRGIFDFNTGVLRWTWRVVYYLYNTNQYPAPQND